MTASASSKHAPTRLSRRDALRVAGGAGAAALLGANAAAQGGAGEIAIPSPVASLPTEDVTFRWIDSGGLKALFFNPFFEAYQQVHPNIAIQYDALAWEEIGRIVPLGVQNGEAHDIFAMPLDIPSSQAVAEGWVAPLDDIIPNFAEWKARFPLGALQEGVHVFDGKTYTFPLSSSKRYWTMTFYNTAYLQQAGYDLEQTPLTWDQYREVARTITEQGQGQYYGVMFGAQSEARLATFVRNLGRMAGASAGGSLGFEDIDWRTGEFQYTSDEYRAAIDVLLGLQADGSIFPGSLSLVEAEARAQFPQGVAGLLLEGPWCIPDWQRDAPDFVFGLASQPLPMTYEEEGGNFSWVYSGSPYKQIAGDMFTYMGSVEGQVALMAASGGNLRAIFPEAAAIAQESVALDPLASEALTLYEEQLRLGPMVTVRNPGAARVAFERRQLTPNFGELVQGMLAGQIPDVRAAMQDLQNRSDAELDRAIEAARAAGAQVTRDDFVFPNWNPTQDYGQADYAALDG